MDTRYLLIGIVATSLGTFAAAEPVKPEPRSENPPAARPAEVLLASAQQLPAEAPVPQQQAATPAKKRAARVTSCRCADQNDR